MAAPKQGQWEGAGEVGLAAAGLALRPLRGPGPSGTCLRMVRTGNNVKGSRLLLTRATKLGSCLDSQKRMDLYHLRDITSPKASVSCSMKYRSLFSPEGGEN